MQHMQRISTVSKLRRLFLTGVLCTAGVSFAASATVLTSTKPLGFIAAAITDGVTQTEVLLPDGASPHDYALRPSDVQKIRSASLVVWVGPDMEAFLSKPLAQVDESRKIALAEWKTIKPLLSGGEDSHDREHEHEHVTQSIDNKEHDDDDGHHHGGVDMHIWMSPEIAQRSAVIIHDKLLELMPQNKDKLDANLAQFEKELGKTKENIANIMQPLRGKGYFVFHDAYGYFEKAFGLTQSGHFTINPEIQPGAQRLHSIRTQLVEHKAVCVFAEPQFQPAVVNAVAKGTDVRIGVLDPLGSNITLGKDSYLQLLTQLSQQFASCLE
ncbi:High-affinity zinc uptake system protein znuA precursor [Leminorella richardii]|uniref:High-affinity zinc uptake system protein ZnuA n=1 Tax=Leminorella richardii TaxID=158841 RepID=A0A2X4UQW5_9GAMM|nr:zinc ABC transporter substrate-binding protein ZnuA [Leminorella richardii]SQI41243.1 High-affinity zinc uptake system protein znuA precursor [Leminorella richardii]